MTSTGNVAGVCFTILFLLGQRVNAVPLALNNLRGARGADETQGVVVYEPHTKMPDGLEIEVTKEEKPKINVETTCLCPMGQFWHWRINECIDQGYWGYECGFFPMEHHHRVCVDGLKCERLMHPVDTEWNETKKPHHIDYHDFGKSLLTGPKGDEGNKGNAYPASCQPCQAKDKCLTGKERHYQDCMKKYTIEGGLDSKVCVTVKVSNLKSEAAAIMQKATVEWTSERSAKATVKAEYTAKATATFKATAKVALNATKSDTHTVKATSTKTYKYALLQQEPDVDDKEVTFGKVDDKEAATKTRTAIATKTKVVTSSAEATAVGAATAETKASATVIAKGKGTHESTVEKSATAQAHTSAPGLGEAKGCATIREGYKELKVKTDTKLDAVLANQIVSATGELAWGRAVKAALEMAKKGIAKSTKVEQAKALAEATEKAEALAREAAAWRAEAGANREALVAAWRRALAAAKARAEAAAKEEAEKAADRAAARTVFQAAWDKAKQLAEAAAMDGATTKAKLASQDAAKAAAQIRAEYAAAVAAQARAKAWASKCAEDHAAAKAAYADAESKIHDEWVAKSDAADDALEESQKKLAAAKAAAKVAETLQKLAETDAKNAARWAHALKKMHLCVDDAQEAAKKAKKKMAAVLKKKKEDRTQEEKCDALDLMADAAKDAWRQAQDCMDAIKPTMKSIANSVDGARESSDQIKNVAATDESYAVRATHRRADHLVTTEKHAKAVVSDEQAVVDALKNAWLRARDAARDCRKNIKKEEKKTDEKKKIEKKKDDGKKKAVEKAEKDEKDAKKKADKAKDDADKAEEEYKDAKDKADKSKEKPKKEEKKEEKPKKKNKAEPKKEEEEEEDDQAAVDALNDRVGNSDRLDDIVADASIQGMAGRGDDEKPEPNAPRKIPKKDIEAQQP